MLNLTQIDLLVTHKQVVKCSSSMHLALMLPLGQNVPLNEALIDHFDPGAAEELVFNHSNRVIRQHSTAQSLFVWLFTSSSDKQRGIHSSQRTKYHLVVIFTHVEHNKSGGHEMLTCVLLRAS